MINDKWFKEINSSHLESNIDPGPYFSNTQT